MTEEEFAASWQALITSEAWTGGTQEEQDELLESWVVSLESIWPAIVGHVAAIVQYLKQWFGLSQPRPGIVTWFNAWWQATFSGLPPYIIPPGGA